MTTTQVVETSASVNNSPNQDYVHPHDHTQPTYEMTPRLILQYKSLLHYISSLHVTRAGRIKFVVLIEQYFTSTDRQI